MQKFKLIREFPLSPAIGDIVTFESEEDYEYGINNVGDIPCLMIYDCEYWPEFWEEVTE